MNIKETFLKQGGLNLLRQYLKSGSFFTAVCQFILLGKSRTALELLRMSASLKTKQKLERKYRNVLEKFEINYDESIEHKSSNKIWICWFQGIENAPDLVKRCYYSLVNNIPDKEIIVITSDNIENYVTFPAHILSKWKSGAITHTHMTDLLRLELLIRYGGTWIDSTVFCSGGNIPDYFFDSELFFFQCLKPGRDGHASYISSWYMSAYTNNKILMAVRELCYEYWKDNNSLIDYFLLHDFFAIVLDCYEEDWKKIMPRDNATPHLLLLRLFDRYDEKVWTSIKSQTPFHKLSYKYDVSKENLTDTYYQIVINR